MKKCKCRRNPTLWDKLVRLVRKIPYLKRRHQAQQDRDYEKFMNDMVTRLSQQIADDVEHEILMELLTEVAENDRNGNSKD